MFAAVLQDLAMMYNLLVLSTLNKITYGYIFVHYLVRNKLGNKICHKKYLHTGLLTKNETFKTHECYFLSKILGSIKLLIGFFIYDIQ